MKNYNNKDELIEKIKTYKEAGEICPLAFASEELKEDLGVVLLAMAEHPQNFKFVSEKLKNDKCFVQDIVCNFAGWIMQYVNDDLRNDKTLLKLSLNNQGRYQNLAIETMKDKELVLLAIEKISPQSMPHLFRSFNDEHKFDIEVLKQVTLKNHCALQFLPQEVKKDKKIIKELVQINGLILQYAHRDLKHDKEIIQCALNENMKSYSYVSHALRKKIGSNNPLIYLKNIELNIKLNNDLQINTTSNIKVKI